MKSQVTSTIIHPSHLVQALCIIEQPAVSLIMGLKLNQAIITKNGQIVIYKLPIQCHIKIVKHFILMSTIS